MFDVKDKLHINCNFVHNLFKTCVSASPLFLVRFDTIIRFLFISVSNVEGSVQHLTTSRDITWTPNCWNYQALSYISEFIWCDPGNIWGPIWHSFSFGMLISFVRPYPGVQYIRNLQWRKFWDSLSPDWTFGLLISLINDKGSTGPPTAWPNQAIVAFDRPYPGLQYIQKLRWRKS